MRIRSCGFTVLLLGALGVASSPAGAVLVVERGPGLDLAIPDDGYNGTLRTMACDDLQVPVSGKVLEAWLTVALDHTWIGDLVVKLRSPSLTLVTVLSRPGFAEAADDGAGGFGDSSNLIPSAPIEFRDGAAVSAESMGATIDNAHVVCQDDLQCSFDPFSGTAAPGDLSTFVGQLQAGTWTLCIGDSAPGDLGTLDGWSLHLDTTAIFNDDFDEGDFCAWSSHAGIPPCV